MSNAHFDKSNPIYSAIDRGGGQTCDIAAIIREIDRAGYIIVPKIAWDKYDLGNMRHDNAWVALVEAANK